MKRLLRTLGCFGTLLLLAIGISGATSPQDGIVAKAGADELEKILQGN